MKIKILVTCIIVLVATSVQSQSFYNTDISMGGTNTNNLYKNSSKQKDHMASIKGTLNLYPVHIGQINVFTEYTNYGVNPDLSNLKYGGGFTLLPLRDSSRFSLYLNMNYQEYSYKDALTTNSTEFTNKNVNSAISLGYQINQKTFIRSGFNHILTGYASDSVTDKKSQEIFSGINLSLFGSNAFDLEAGYSFEKYDYIPEYDTLFNRHYAIASRNAYKFLNESDLNSYYFSFRFSRPLGSKTGIAINYSFREFTKTQDSSMVYGYSTGYLSPWIASYHGNSVQVKVKTYLIPFTIINIGMGYWNSAYLRTLESEEIFDMLLQETVFITNTKNGINRNDDKYRFFASIAVPIVTSSGRLFEPILTFDYTDNESTIANYTYTDFTASITLNIR